MLKDAVALTTRERTPEGYLRAVATITKVGVQDYYGHEIAPLLNTAVDPNKLYGVFRPPETVFHPDTIKSATLKPITDSHPQTDVDADNYAVLSIGNSGERCSKIGGDKLGISIIFTDSEAIEKVDAGTHEISAGYEGTLVQDSGVYQGRPYQFKLDGAMQINHLALVDQGRCGDSVRILDSKSEVKKVFKKSKTLKDVDMDGLMNKVSAQIMPDIQKMVNSDDFAEKLATIIGNKLSSYISGASPDVEQEAPEIDSVEDEGIVPTDDDTIMDEDNVEAPAETAEAGNSTFADKTAATSLQTSFNDAVNMRVDLIDLVKQLDPKVKTRGRSNKVILQDALQPIMGDEVKERSYDYLLGMAHAERNRRQDVESSYRNVKLEDNGSNRDEYGVEQGIPANGLRLRTILKD